MAGDKQRQQLETCIFIVMAIRSEKPRKDFHEAGDVIL